MNMVSELVIKTHPANMTIGRFDDATFSVEAEGRNLTYQWYFNRQMINGIL